MIDRTEVTINNLRVTKKLENIPVGTWFLYKGICYIKMCKMINGEVECFSLSIYAVIPLKIDFEVEPYSRIEINPIFRTE